jgi:hypothetical protein
MREHQYTINKRQHKKPETKEGELYPPQCSTTSIRDDVVTPDAKPNEKR